MMMVMMVMMMMNALRTMEAAVNLPHVPSHLSAVHAPVILVTTVTVLAAQVIQFSQLVRTFPEL